MNELTTELTEFEPRIINRIVNGYTLLDVLGSGGLTIAHRAEKDGRDFCIRELRYGKSTSDFSPHKVVELFEREADILARLEHPKIPKVHELFSVSNNGQIDIYMVQDLIHGKNLKKFVRENGSLSEEKVIDILLQLTDVLKYIHNQKPSVIHRDIKPSNIMLNGDEVYLIDFGVVQERLVQTIGGSTMFGTFGYAPLEIMAGQATTQSDIYMLGTTALYLLSGLDVPIELMEGVRLDYKRKIKFENMSIDVLIERLTEQEIKDRPQTAEQVADYLQKIKDGKALTRIAEQKPNWLDRLIARIVGKRTLSYLVGKRKAEVDKIRNGVSIEPNAESIKLPDVNGESSVDFRGQNVHYIKMPTASYGSALKNLRDACAEDKNSKQPLLDGIPRPLTLKEIFIARIMQHELWDVFLDPIGGIAYSSQDKNMFKINQVCRELAGLSEGFDRSYLPIDYNGFNGVELDRRNALYDQLLTREQFLAPHPAWHVALEGDTDLMRAIADKVYIGQRRRGLGFYLFGNPQEDQLRHLFVDYIGYSSGAFGGGNLIYNCRFLRVIPN